MAKNSEIQWTNHTWNPWQGCRKISAGCQNCYMYAAKKRYGQDPSNIVRSATGTFNAPLKWNEPARVFVCSWSDFFHEDADQWRDDAWSMMRKTPHLIYLLLTKRAENIKDRLPVDWPLPNVWLGVTVEHQATARRVDILREIPAPVKFVSAEPLLEPVTLDLTGISWLIAGCESNGGRPGRLVPLQAFRSLRDQCKEQNVLYFLKQAEINGRLVSEPELDGQQWQEVPEVKGGQLTLF